jgi:signal transduction histidine kinase
MMSSHIQIPPQWTPRLRWAFVLIIAGFIISGIVSIYEMRDTQAEVRLIVERALASIQLVSQLSHDIARERLLFLDHVTSKQTADKARIEAGLATADARIAASSRAYEQTIADEAERAAWENLQTGIAAVRAKARSVLDLSRANANVEAMAAMKNLEPEFDAVDDAMDALARLNRTRADEEVGRIRDLQRIAVILLAGLTAVWTVFSLLIANWVTRLIRQRESQMRNVTSLLQERNRELDAFAGRVAHDLRGPLTAINLAAFVKSASHEEAPNAVFRRGVKQMETIIQDLLTLSRVSAQTTDETSETTMVAASVEEDLRQEVETAGGMLRVEVAAATVRCSHGLLRQVLWNLGENAVKFRHPDVRLEVEIRGRLLPHTYEFSVSDNGAGMSTTEAKHVFDPFFRGEQVGSIPGTGLGLSIVKRVAEANGGSVSVDSAVGRGSTFKVFLPLVRSKAA